MKETDQEPFDDVQDAKDKLFLEYEDKSFRGMVADELSKNFTNLINKATSENEKQTITLKMLKAIDTIYGGNNV